MAFVLHSTRSVSRSGVRILSVRQAVICTGAGVLVLGGLAFGAGMLVGQYHSEQTTVIASMPKDAVKEKFTFDRLGDMTGRLVKLESDTHSLLQKLGALENLQTRLARLGDGKSSVLPNTTRGISAGGQMMPPKDCTSKDLKSGSTPKEMDAAEKAMVCLQGLLDRVEVAASRQSVAYMAMPIEQPVNSTRIGSGFGNRVDPINGHLSFHPGIDFDAPIGTQIRSAGGGRVTQAGWVNELGNVVAIDHGNGLTTRYAHTSKVYVKIGDVVTPGQPIAEVGTTGRSTGPHLHFEILHNGQYVDPSSYLSIGAQVPNV
jgi:hypothetical protein